SGRRRRGPPGGGRRPAVTRAWPLPCLSPHRARSSACTASPPSRGREDRRVPRQHSPRARCMSTERGRAPRMPADSAGDARVAGGRPPDPPDPPEPPEQAPPQPQEAARRRGGGVARETREATTTPTTAHGRRPLIRTPT